MPSEPYRKVGSGQPFEIRSVAWNRLMDLARANDLGNTGAGVPEFPRRQTLCKVQNNSGAAVARFGVLGISGPLITPANNLPEFQRQLAFAGVTPAAGTHFGKFVITLEPIASAKIGNAVVAGVAPVLLSVSPGAGVFTADINPGSTANLAPAACGSAEILTYDAGTGWALVRLGTEPYCGPCFKFLADVAVTVTCSSNVITTTVTKTFKWYNPVTQQTQDTAC